uniref:Uncharacterized protein n=1 Tax=Chenopodium quinoa TaxID=63459 RepID=A0A803NDE1_CHEQI
MCSLDLYKKFKEELNRLLSEGDNLNEEDKHFINFISNSNTPKDVLNLVKEMKEEGNELYKQRSFDEALEKYGFAGVILSRIALELEEDIRLFHDLARCTLLNLAGVILLRRRTSTK